MLSTLLSGPDDLIIIVVALVVIFGGSQLPKLARNAGEAMKEFRKAGSGKDGKDTDPSATTAQPAQAAATPAVGIGQAAPLPLASSEERVTLSKTDLDALLAEHEARVRSERSEPQP
jgi:sec-independent protein translocase protein TatA